MAEKDDDDNRMNWSAVHLFSPSSSTEVLLPVWYRGNPNRKEIEVLKEPKEQEAAGPHIQVEDLVENDRDDAEPETGEGEGVDKGKDKSQENKPSTGGGSQKSSKSHESSGTKHSPILPDQKMKPILVTTAGRGRDSSNINKEGQDVPHLQNPQNIQIQKGNNEKKKCEGCSKKDNNESRSSTSPKYDARKSAAFRTFQLTGGEPPSTPPEKYAFSEETLDDSTTEMNNKKTKSKRAGIPRVNQRPDTSDLFEFQNRNAPQVKYNLPPISNNERYSHVTPKVNTGRVNSSDENKELRIIKKAHRDNNRDSSILDNTRHPLPLTLGPRLHPRALEYSSYLAKKEQRRKISEMKLQQYRRRNLENKLNKKMNQEEEGQVPSTNNLLQNQGTLTRDYQSSGRSTQRLGGFGGTSRPGTITTTDSLVFNVRNFFSVANGFSSKALGAFPSFHSSPAGPGGSAYRPRTQIQQFPQSQSGPGGPGTSTRNRLQLSQIMTKYTSSYANSPYLSPTQRGILKKALLEQAGKEVTSFAAKDLVPHVAADTKYDNIYIGPYDATDA